MWEKVEAQLKYKALDLILRTYESTLCFFFSMPSKFPPSTFSKRKKNHKSPLRERIEKNPKFVYEKYVSIARVERTRRKKTTTKKLGQTADCGACLGKAQMMKRKIYKTMYTLTHSSNGLTIQRISQLRWKYRKKSERERALARFRWSDFNAISNKPIATNDFCLASTFHFCFRHVLPFFFFSLLIKIFMMKEEDKMFCTNT